MAVTMVVALVAVAALAGFSLANEKQRPTVTVQLPADRDAGYTWVCSVKPQGSFVTVDSVFGPGPSGISGVGDVQTFVLESRAEGDATVSFACVDPDDGSIDSTASYTFHSEDGTIVQKETKADISEELLPASARKAAVAT